MLSGDRCGSVCERLFLVRGARERLNRRKRSSIWAVHDHHFFVALRHVSYFVTVTNDRKSDTGDIFPTASLHVPLLRLLSILHFPVEQRVIGLWNTDDQRGQRRIHLIVYEATSDVTWRERDDMRILLSSGLG